jgi:outer membrane biogenesis lipoprotein LolB
MLRFRLAALALVASALLTACGGESSTSEQGPLTSSELGWIREETRWAFDI